MPEHAMSTVKFIVVPSGLVMRISGLPYSLIRVDGIPARFTRLLEICELRVDRMPPKVYRISDGGGTMKKRNAMGNASWCSVCGLNRSNTEPVVKSGRASR